MNSIQIEKLIEHIDQLVFWLRDNPQTPIPSIEKRRIEAILKKIVLREEMTNEEWEQLKPKQQSSAQSNNNIWSTIRQALSYNKTEKVIPSKIKEARGKLPNNLKLQSLAQSEWTKCLGCSVKVLRKNLAKHKNRCKPKANKKVSNRPISAPVNNQKTGQTISNPLTESKEEKRLDGAYGFHQFREDGKFGSYPSFDNMGDDAHP